MAEPLPPRADAWSPRHAVLATLVVGAVVAAFLLLYTIRAVLFLLFVAIVVATALRPFVSWFERRGATHIGAVGGVYAIILVVAVGIVVVAGPLIFDQTLGILAATPEYYEKARAAMLESSSTLVVRIASRLPEHLAQAAREGEVVAEAVSRVAQTVQYAGIGLRGVLVAFAVMLLAFYWSLQEERTIRLILLIAPSTRRDDARELIDAMLQKVGAFIRGQGILCLAIMVMALVAYLVIGLPYAVLLAITAGVLEAVPYFGPVLGAVAPALVAFSVDPQKVIWVIVAATVMQQIENHLLVPRVMDRSVGVNPVVTLLAIAGFSSLFGIAGAILAIPMAAIIQLLLDRFLLGSEALVPEQPAGRGQASMLRYQTQELIHDIRMRARHREELPAPETDRLEDLIETVARDLDELLTQKSEAESQSAPGATGTLAGERR